MSGIMVTRDRKKIAVLLLAAILLAAASVGGTLTALAARRVHPERTLPVPGATTAPGLELNFMWLARHQAPDGSWRADLSPICSTCGSGAVGESTIRLTGESLLAFLGAGYTPQNRASYVDPVNGRTCR